MKNKAKLAFELLEQEMEVIYKEDLMQVVGGITWQEFVNAVNSGNLSSIEEGAYIMSSNGTIEYGGGAIFGGELNNVNVSGNSSGGYGYSSSGGFNWGNLTPYLNDPYFMNSQFWAGSGYSSGGYASGGGGGGGYFVSPTYVPTGSSSGSTTYYPILNYDWEDYSQWNLEAVADVFHGMGDSVNNMGIVLTSTGVFSEIGVPLMGVGGAISFVGTGIDLYSDIMNNTPETFDYGAWAVTLGLEANALVFGKLTTTNGEKVIFELSQNGIEYVYDSVMN